MVIKYRSLRFAAVCCCVLAVVIFFWGWLSAGAASVFTALLTAGFAAFIRSAKEDDGEKQSVKISGKCIIALLVISLVWCWLAGQGHFFQQSSDHVYRNAIFHDLIKKPWPVVYENGSLLSYYIAHWMPPALVGKIVYLISGSVFAGYLTGNIALLLWSAFGCFIVLLLAVLLTSAKGRNHVIIAALMFVFFSGLDWLGTEITGHTSSLGIHYEWWAEFAQFSSVTTCLFWVFNQAIIPWMITMCIINEKSVKNLAFLGILAFPFGPFPFVGIVFMCLVKGVCIAVKERKQLSGVVKNAFSVQNIAAVISVFLPFALYFTSNVMLSSGSTSGGGGSSAASTGFRLHHLLTDASADYAGFFGKYLLFMLLEVGVYLILMHKRIHRNPFFICSMIGLAVTPLFQIGTAYDFAMRVSIPMLTYMAVEFISMVMEMLPEKIPMFSVKGIAAAIQKMIDEKSILKNLRKNLLLILSAAVFIIGAVNAKTEFEREILQTFISGFPNPSVEYYYQESLEDFKTVGNFTAKNYTESNFYKYICKKQNGG